MSKSDSLKVAVQITKSENGLRLRIDFKEIFARYNFGNSGHWSFDVNPRAKNDEWGVVSPPCNKTSNTYIYGNGYLY